MIEIKYKEKKFDLQDKEGPVAAGTYEVISVYDYSKSKYPVLINRYR